MKQFVLITLLLTMCCSSNSKEKSVAENYQKQTENVQSDTLLLNVEKKIYSAFVQAMISQDNKTLIDVSSKLEALNKTKKQNLILYWRAYLQFYSSIYYLQKGDKKTSEKEIDKAIDWLKEMPKKNSEDYALLSMLQGFAIQFKGMKAMFISKSIKKNATTAITIDPTNLRAYYVYGSNDFYTPEKYGGGKETEKYLLKAISLPAQRIKNDYLPSWGKEEAYELLIKFYIRKENWEQAKKYFQEGIKLFPDSYQLSQLGAELVDK